MSERLKGYHLLIAEDNPTNQIVVARIVQQLGATFDIASDGVEAIQLFDPKRHHLALLDIEMPRKSGLEVIRYIRSRSDTAKDFPIVALTAFVLAEHRAKIRDVGADAILAKPITDIDAFGNELMRQLNISNQVSTGESALFELETTMGQAVMPELLSSLQADLETLSTRIGEAIPKDREELASSAHSVVSLARLMGDEALAAHCQDLESQVKNFDEDTTNRKFSELRTRIEMLLEQIDNFKKRYDDPS